MAVSRPLLASLFSLAAWAQQPAPPSQADQQPTIRTTVDVVVAPVTVLDRDHNFVDGLQPQQFHLYDNGKEQNIKVDVTFQPLSLVIAIQANDHVEAVLPQIQRIGSLIEPLVSGEQGEVAVLAFDHRLRVMQPFTSDANKVVEGIKKIHAGSTTSRLTDAVAESVRLLQSRPINRRRIVLLISETREGGSEGRVRDALIDAQLANVMVYAVDITRWVTTLTAKPQPPRPDNRPPAMHPLPSNVPATPTTVAQASGGEGGRAEFIPVMVEVFKDVKAIFKDNPVEVFTKGTGGDEQSFVRERGLEKAIARIGQELHSQYLVSYNPNNKEEGGFHEIRVEIAGRGDVKVRTRPGYWLGVK